ncbi:MAG: MerR family transcriptional regulator, partial [Lachnospiraceae bacterium]|nr:MerR family transcriptional regulator [Lachnospiraceae bacterium]
MTIKEMESASGISRANIRYYEAEGLLHPARGENGYRDYSEEDLGLLKKIQLCRILGFSLEKIRRMIGGEADLEKTARERVEAIGEERYALQAAERVCRQICEDRASFASMDAERYLGLLREQEKRTEEVELSDRLPVVRAPWRRFFARMTDLEILTALWHLFLGAGLHVNLEQRAAGGRILDIVVVMVLMLVIEPVFLHF